MSMKKGVSIFAALILFGAGGCSDEGETVAVPEKPAQPQTQTENDIWETPRQPMHKAEGVEQQMLDAAEQRRKEMEKQGL
jgi:hypothetical protein